MKLLIAALLVTGQAFAQQTAKTTEPQARSYVATALMTGAAPTILSDNVKVAPELRQRLGVAPEADNKTVYQALVDLTPGKAVHVRRAAADEVEKTQAAAPGRPMFAVEVGDATLILQYDLERDHIVYAGLPAGMAIAAPAGAPAAPPPATPVPPVAPVPVAQQPEMKSEPPEMKSQPTAEPPAAVQKPEPPGLQVVDPQVPREPRPVAAAPARPAQPAATAAARPPEPQRPLLRKSGPCEIKPVMSDQDLVNCGATPR